MAQDTPTPRGERECAMLEFATTMWSTRDDRPIASSPKKSTGEKYTGEMLPLLTITVARTEILCVNTHRIPTVLVVPSFAQAYPIAGDRDRWSSGEGDGVRVRASPFRTHAVGKSDSMGMEGRNLKKESYL